MHMALFNVPLTIAARYDVPLVVWGEDSATEYSGDAAPRAFAGLDCAWLEQVRGHSTAPPHAIGSETADRQDLTPYFGPHRTTSSPRRGSERCSWATSSAGTRRRPPAGRASTASRRRAEGPLTGYYAYADIDDAFLISIHHWLKWLKFGFTRT